MIAVKRMTFWESFIEMKWGLGPIEDNHIFFKILKCNVLEICSTSSHFSGWLCVPNYERWPLYLNACPYNHNGSYMSSLYGHNLKKKEFFQNFLSILKKFGRFVSILTSIWLKFSIFWEILGQKWWKMTSVFQNWAKQCPKEPAFSFDGTMI